MSSTYVRQEKIYLPGELVSSGIGYPFFSYEGNAVDGSDLWTTYSRISPDGEGGRHDWKPFEHHKVSCSAPTMSPGYRITRVDSGYGIHSDVIYNPLSFYTTYYGEPGRWLNNLPAFANIGDESERGFVNDPSDISLKRSQCLAALTPYINAELSALNSVYELKDIPSIVGTVKSVLEFAKKVPRNPKSLSKLLRSLSRKDLASFTKKFVSKVSGASREALRVASDVYLQQMFNVGPLVSDIRSVHAALSTTEKRLRRFINRAGQPRIGHYTRSWVEFEDTTEMSPVTASYGKRPMWTNFECCINLKYSRRVQYLPTEFHGEIEFSFYYPQFQLEHARALALLDQLGINFNPRIIWNAIPWSFVVDWVLGVNTFLNGLTSPLLNPVIRIHRYLDSVKRMRTINVSKHVQCLDSWWDPPTGDFSEVPAPAVHETSYKRYTGLPSYASFRSSGLSSTELSLGAALGLSRRKHHR